MLRRFRAAKASEIQRLKRAASLGRLPVPDTSARPSFSAALRGGGCSVIAEYKRVSPSRGAIDLKRSPEEAAAGYASGGASAMSVLTEEVHFRGELSYLGRMTAPGLPLLRKDFLFEPEQVVETAATPASALLLIVRMFDDPARLREMIELTESLGMEAVVEVFDDWEIPVAREAGASIIQVNNRDLSTLRVNIGHAADCMARHGDAPERADEVWIAASGVTTPGDMRMMADAGYDAALVGTSVMAAADPAACLAALVLAGREVPETIEADAACGCVNGLGADPDNDVQTAPAKDGPEAVKSAAEKTQETTDGKTEARA